MPVQTSAAQVVYYSQFDTAPALVALLSDGAATPVDLTGATVTISIAYGRYSYFYSPTRRIVSNFPCFVTDALLGEVEYRPDPDHLDPPGEFQYTFEVTFPDNPDGKYLLKGATRAVWNAYRVPDKWRSKRGEGMVDGKRCGTTQNIGPAARRQWHEGQGYDKVEGA